MKDQKQKEKNIPRWNPGEKRKQRIAFVYDERKDMIDKRNESYVQFNDRTLREFIDDNEKRLNAYVLDKASQGKEEWQANYATRIYANKAKALLAATSRTLPEMRYKAVDNGGRYNYFAADMIKNLVRHSYNQDNIQEEMFFLAWSNVGKGTVLSYEGFQKQNFIKKRIKSFDLLTGDVEEEEIENVSEGEPVSFEIPLMHLLIKNYYIRDIQQQPAIIFESYYADKERFDADWGKYPNAKYVKNIKDINTEESETYFHSFYKEESKKGNGYVVSRYMNVYKDIYRVVANGIELYNGPMLWVDITRKNLGRKVYPVAKAIYEPFANSDFFYGNAMPNTAMGEGDTINTLYNTAMDKEYRALVPALLVGQVNKDMLDLEDEVVAGDTKIYVDDINQVKQMEMKGVSDSTIKMIDIVSRGIDLTTLDPQQQGAAQKYVTARAAVAADERARQLKGIFFMFMESLWLQKIKLRIPNIFLSYTKPQIIKIIGKDNVEKLEVKPRIFNIDNTELSDGQKGTLAIQLTSKEKIGEAREDIESEEERNKMEGRPFEAIAFTYEYLEQFSYNTEVIPETL